MLDFCESYEAYACPFFETQCRSRVIWKIHDWPPICGKALFVSFRFSVTEDQKEKSRKKLIESTYTSDGAWQVEWQEGHPAHKKNPYFYEPDVLPATQPVKTPQETQWFSRLLFHSHGISTPRLTNSVKALKDFSNLSKFNKSVILSPVFTC